MTATWQDVADLGVAYSATVDRRAALQTVLSGAANMLVISGPVAIARNGAGAALSLTANFKRIRFVGGGYLISLGTSISAPDLLFDMQGVGNVLEDPMFWNKNDCGQPANYFGGPENPMDAMWVRGIDNHVLRARMLHFYTGIRNWYSDGASIVDAVCTVKDKGQDLNNVVSGTGWSNDGIMCEGTKYGRVVRPKVAVSTGAAAISATVAQPSLTGNKHRCGIGIDGNGGSGNIDLLIDAPIVGDGFVDQIHTEGDSSIIIRAPQLGRGRRNAMTLAAAGTQVEGGRADGIFGGAGNLSPVDEVNGVVVCNSGVQIKGTKIGGALDNSVPQAAFRLMANSENQEIDVRLEGDFGTLIRGTANNVQFHATFKGSCGLIYDIDQPYNNPPRFYTCEVSGVFDGVKGVAGRIGRDGSGLAVKCHDMSVSLPEGYVAGDLFFIDGSPYADVPELVPTWERIDVKYLGTTPLTGTKAFVRSGVAGPESANLHVRVKDCSWPSSFVRDAAAGNWVSAPNWALTGNTSNTIGP